MAETDYGSMEVLIGNPHSEAENCFIFIFIQQIISQVLYRGHLISSLFHMANGAAFHQPRMCLLKLLKIIPGCQKLVLQQYAHTLIFKYFNRVLVQ